MGDIVPKGGDLISCIIQLTPQIGDLPSKDLHLPDAALVGLSGFGRTSNAKAKLAASPPAKAAVSTGEKVAGPANGTAGKARPIRATNGIKRPSLRNGVGCGDDIRGTRSRRIGGWWIRPSEMFKPLDPGEEAWAAEHEGGVKLNGDAPARTLA